MIAVDLIRDDEGAVALLNKRGMFCPVIDGHRNVGFLMVRKGEARGAAVIVPSQDGEDVEVLADGGWTVHAARKFFATVFHTFGHERLSARCYETNVRGIRAFTRMGFVREGVKRCRGGNLVLLGMFPHECRFLKGRA